MYVPLFFRSPFIAALCLILVASVRFNRNDLIIKRPLNDAAFYISNVEKIRGIEPTTYDYKGPFNERILVTTLAAFLPFSPLTSINLINLLFLSAGLFYLYKLLKVSGLSDDFVWLGVYIFIFSFPTFYYSTIGYIDPSVLAAIFCGTYALYSNRYGLFIAAIIAGAFSKENIVILIPVALAYAYSRNNRQWVMTGLASLIIILIINFTMKKYLFQDDPTIEAIYWKPNLSRFIWNIQRPHFLISTFLSSGIPILSGIYFFFRYNKQISINWKEELPLWAGLLSIAGITLYMISAAFPDGRNVWVAYCFPVLLSLKWWERLGSKSANASSPGDSSGQNIQTKLP